MFLESDSSPVFPRIPGWLRRQVGIILCCICPFSCLSGLHCPGSCAFHGGRGHLSIVSFVLSRKAGVSRDWWLVYTVTGKKTCWLCFFFFFFPPARGPIHSFYWDFLVRELLWAASLGNFLLYFSTVKCEHIWKKYINLIQILRKETMTEGLSHFFFLFLSILNYMLNYV